jgi:hypothetical protein
MKKGFWLIVLLTCLVAPRFVVAADAPAMGEAPVAPAPLDMVTLKDGGVLYGEVIEMSGGVLFINLIKSLTDLQDIGSANNF